jgi:tetratricopeptide (TPR) repeat protein
LDIALARNPGNLRVLGFYAEYISPTEPERALAIRQRLQRNEPSVRNTMLLGMMAMRIAVKETNADKKEALFAIAASSFEEAQALEPQNKAALEARAAYYRITGQEEKAEELLAQSRDEKLLWVHYFRTGKFENAKRLLEQLYQTGSKDAGVVKGLLLIAEKAADTEAVKKYSEELISLSSDEDSIENRLVQIQIFLKAGLLKEAEYKLQSFKEKYSEQPGALLLEAWLAMRQGQLKKALELTNQNLEIDQDNTIAWRLRGEINRLMANYGQAIADLNRSKLLSDEPVTRISLAKAYLRVGRQEDAITELKSTIDYPDAPREARVLLEQIYRWLGRKDRLKRFYDDILDKSPSSVFWHNRAAAFALAAGDFNRAEQLYGRAWQEGREGRGDRGSAEEAFNGYLQALLSGGKLDKVFKEAQECVDGEFAPVAFIGMAEAKLKLADKATAIEYCRKAVDRAGTNEALGSWALQRMYLLLGMEEVLRYCRERLDADPDSLVANFTMYSLTRIKGEYHKAIVYIDKCQQIIEPGTPQEIDYIVKKVEVLQLIYNRTSDNNYLQRAITEYESLLAKKLNNPVVLNNVAYMLAENNERLTKALEYAERAYELRPNDPGFLDTYSYVLYKNGRFSEAAEFLQSALQQYESRRTEVPAEVYEHLGIIKEKLEAPTEALAAYEQALQVGTNVLSDVAKERINSAIERLSRQAGND